MKRCRRAKLLFATLKECTRHFGAAARGTGLTVLWPAVCGYFKDSPLLSVTAQQRAYSRAFGHLFNEANFPFSAEDLQHQIEELLPASFLLLLGGTATQIATAPERHQVVGH